jgi:hypothetical protein
MYRSLDNYITNIIVWRQIIQVILISKGVDIPDHERQAQRPDHETQAQIDPTMKKKTPQSHAKKK